jgi:DNA recombination protein RmuC
MSGEFPVYALLFLAIANLGLLGWLIARGSGRHGGAGRGEADLFGRIEALDRNDEALRRSLVEMDQALRREISEGAQRGLAAAFDKVQDGTRTQSDQLGRFGEQQALRLQQMDQAVREAAADTTRALAEQREIVVARLGKELGELAERVGQGFAGFGERLRAEQEQLRERVGGKLEEIRSGNEAKLEAMRRAVDEQLQSALQKRLDESFQRVTEQFAQVQQAIGQVQSVSGQIGDLKRLFSNVKSRGGWGEAHLQALLDDVLPQGAYECNFRIAQGSGDFVEFALRMPLRGAGEPVWLAIDAKFPTEDYDRLRLAGESGSPEEEAVARRALERRIREEAKRIAAKYIAPPRTVEFAVMYLPSEGLFAEIHRTPGLVETVRRQHRVMIMGPGLLPALLHCIRVGHLTLALEQKAGAIGEILAAVKVEWANLGRSLETLARRADSLSRGIVETQKSARKVGRRLETVDAIDAGRAEEVLGLAADDIASDNPPDDELDPPALAAQ